MGIHVGKTALVTGASRGIGRSVAKKLAAEGARVIGHYGNSAVDAASLVQEVREAGGDIDMCSVDLRSGDGAARLATAAAKISGGKIDILVSNAAIATTAGEGGYQQQVFDDLFAVNVRSPFFLVQELLPYFQPDSSIVVVTSLSAKAALGWMAAPGTAKASIGRMSAYAATKGALETMVRHFASALGPQGIRVNAIAPGSIATDMAKITQSEEGRQILLSMQALKRIGHPDDVADVVSFFSSSGARHVTGTVVPVDGGSAL